MILRPEPELCIEGRSGIYRALRVLLGGLLPALAAGQTAIALRLDPINLIAPAATEEGVLFAAALMPDGTGDRGTNLYWFNGTAIQRLTNFSGTGSYYGVTGISYAGRRAAYSAMPSQPPNTEEIHLIDPASGMDRVVASDTQGCIKPLCVSCVFACITSVHLAPDAGKVLYSVARQQPFYTVNADGSGLTHLAVPEGALAPAPQRVINSNGLAVFTAGPDVFTMNLDGSGVRQVTKSTDPNYAANATISTDGSWIAFQKSSGVWVAHPDGSGLRRIAAGERPSISADGSRLVFLGNGQIRSVPISGDAYPIVLTRFSTTTPRDAAVTASGAFAWFTAGPYVGTPAAVRRIPADGPSDSRSVLSPYAPRILNANGIVSAAGTGAPSPGSAITLYGVNLGAEELETANSYPLPSPLGGLSLLVNGDAVPLFAVTPWQINAELPQTVPAGAALFQVLGGGATLPPVTAEVRSTSPANFWFAFSREMPQPPFGLTGLFIYQQAAAFHAGTAIAADMDHPAAAGEVLEIYGVGLGVTDPMVQAGMPSPAAPPAQARQKPVVLIGGREAQVVFAGLVPGLAGIYQVNAVVPEGLRPGLQTVSWRDAQGSAAYSSIGVK